MDIRPDYANIERDGKLVQVDPDEVQIGETIVVKPGERIPLDGTILKGFSTLDTSALTGESMPREVEPGMEVISGCINQTGILNIQTTKEFGESTVAKILDLVENSITATPSECSPKMSAPMVAIVIRKFSSNTCPCRMFVIAFQKIYRKPDGHSPGLCQHRKGRKAGSG